MWRALKKFAEADKALDATPTKFVPDKNWTKPLK